MTVATARPHADGIVALLTAAGVLVDRGKAPAGGGWAGNPGTSTFTGYAVLYPFTGRDDAASLAQTHDAFDFSFQITVVGATQDQAIGVMDAVRTALIGVTPVVAGRAAYPVYRMPLDQPISRDDAVVPPVHYGVVQFHFRSEPT
ncbi:hypothetical protein AB0395_41235 [Streptosporangium sp. NPDC051023]|uniref:hypothetical protein n=1 Tax=Streptosporangium sp. NPDC051023 TaxID=3155410 RepID=UPI003450E301